MYNLNYKRNFLENIADKSIVLIVMIQKSSYFLLIKEKKSFNIKYFGLLKFEFEYLKKICKSFV